MSHRFVANPQPGGYHFWAVWDTSKCPPIMVTFRSDGMDRQWFGSARKAKKIAKMMNAAPACNMDGSPDA